MVRKAGLILICILLCGCANERTVLSSQIESAPKISDIKLGSMTYPEIRMSGNDIFANEVKGEIWLSNWMIYESEHNILKREFGGPFVIKVQLYQKSNIKKSSYLSNISGKLYLKSRIIEPLEITYGICPIGFELINSEVLNKGTINLKDRIIERLPNYSCLIFQYSEFVSAEEKFDLELGDIKSDEQIANLKFSFKPMVIRQNSH